MALYARRKTIPIFLDDMERYTIWCNEEGHGKPVHWQYLLSLTVATGATKGYQASNTRGGRIRKQQAYKVLKIS